MKKFAGDIIILHICTKNHSHMMYGSWDMECDRQSVLSIWTAFLLFYSSMDPENQNFEKIKKNTWIYYHFTHVYHKWQSYDIWLLRYGVQQSFLSFWAVFCPFTPLTTRKIQTLKNWKKLLEISSFFRSVPKIMIICHTVPLIWHVTDLIIFHFGLFFTLLPP